ncbi:hypothetical protein RB595_000195 [Gaeumannomyces hyphopodioides]
MPSTIKTSIWEEPPARVATLSSMGDFDTRRRSSPVMPHGAFEISAKATACRATMMATSSPSPTPRAVRPPRRDSLARRLRSNSGLSLHVNPAALRQYTDYGSDGTPVRSEFAVEWGAIDSVSGSPPGGTPGSRMSVASMPPLSWRNGVDGSASPSLRPDIFGKDVVPMVLKNPEASDRLLRFAETRKSAEGMEFLTKLKEYAHCVNTVTSSMAAISSTYMSVAAPSSLRLPHQTSRALNADVKHVAISILPALETLFADARAHVEHRIARELYPAFIRTQLALTASAALATEVRHSARHFDPRFPGLADAFCLADPLQFDCPVAFASDGMADLAGCTPDEIVGRNCRFLQARSGSATAGGGGQQLHPSAARLRAAMQAASMAYPTAAPVADSNGGVLELVLNYRRDADGVPQPFWNLLFICPLTTSTGRVAYYLGGQVNISEAVGTHKELLDILGSAGAPRPTTSSTGRGSSEVGPTSSPLVALRTPRTEDSATAVEGDGSSSGSESTVLPSAKTGRYRHLRRKKTKGKQKKEDAEGDKRGRGDAPAASSNGDDEQQQLQEDERARRRSMPRGFSFKTFRRQHSFENGTSAPPRAPSRTATRTPTATTRDVGSASPTSPLTIPLLQPSPSLTNGYGSFAGSPTCLTPPPPCAPLRYPAPTPPEAGGDTAAAGPPEFLGAYVRHMVLEYAAAEGGGAPARLRVEFCSAAALELLGLPPAKSRVLHQDILAVLGEAAGAAASVTKDFARALLASVADGKSTSNRITIGGGGAALGCSAEGSGGGGGGGGFPFSAARRRSTTAVAGKKKPRVMPSILTGRSESQQQTADDAGATTPSPSARMGDVFEGLAAWKGLGGGASGSGSAGAAPSAQPQQHQKEQDIVCHWTPLRNAEGGVRWVVLILAPASG